MIGKARNIGWFTVTSGVCVLVHNLILIASDAAGLSLIVALTLSYMVVVVVGYVGHSLLSFREPIDAVRFSRYALVMAANLPLAFVTLLIATKVARLPMLLAAPISTLTSFAINYALSRWAIARPAAIKGKHL